MCRLLSRYSKLVCLLIILSGLSGIVYGQVYIPDSLLYREWDMEMMEYRSQPRSEGCDSISHPFHPGQTFYYNVDSVYHLIATCNPDEIVEEIRYFYFIIDLLARPEGCLKYREKLVKAAKQYKSKALERELDVFDTHCFLNLTRPHLPIKWDYFWGLIEKYEQKKDYQTKLRIMERFLFECIGYLTNVSAGGIEKEEIPVIRVINETISTLERMDGEAYLIAPGYFYQFIGLFYYEFKYYDKAIPLFWKNLSLSSDYYYDRGRMTARDYLGNYYQKMGNYNLSDSLYLSILKSPDRVIMRPVDDVVAIGGLAANARLRGEKEEAMRLYTIAMPLALQVKDSTLAGGYAIELGHLFMERGELEKTREMLDIARTYLVAGKLPLRNWEEFYTLARDHSLKISNIDLTTAYIDSITNIRQQIEELYNARVLVYSQQEAFEMERTRKEEQIRRQNIRMVWTAVFSGFILLSLITLVFFYRKLQKKNRNLFLQIKAQDNLLSIQEELKDTDRVINNDTPQRELFARLHAYLIEEKNFTKPEIDIAQLITQLSTNRTYLFEAVKAVTGKTLQEYINYLRLEEAKQLLETTEELIDSIAGMCGYNSVRTFYRLFRSTYTMSPSVYRKMAKREKRNNP